MSGLERSVRTKETLREWVEEVATRTNPRKIVWCFGTQEEYDLLVRQMLSEGTLIELNQKEYPNCYLHRSNPNDVARSEDRTFICTPKKDDAGSTNNWIDPRQTKKILFRFARKAAEPSSILTLNTSWRAFLAKRIRPLTVTCVTINKFHKILDDYKKRLPNRASPTPRS